MPPWLDALFAALVFAFGTPVWITIVVVRHRERMRKLEYARSGSPGLAEDVAALREELARLRETTTHFDMSFDAALERLEHRVARIDAAPPAGMHSPVSAGADPSGNPAPPFVDDDPVTAAAVRRASQAYSTDAARSSLRRS